jgi:hypothetical protein
MMLFREVEFALENGTTTLAFESGTTGLLYEFQYTVYIQAYIGGAWVSLTSDVISAVPLSIRMGITGYGAKDLMAGSGTLTFSLNNSANNSAGLLGYYSPDHANALSGFDIGTRVRCIITDSGTGHAKIYGSIQEIVPQSGQYQARYCEITVADWFEEAALYKLAGVELQAGKTSNQVLQTVLDAMPTTPDNTDFDTGPDVFAYSLHSDDEEDSSAMSAIQKIIQSDMSHLYLKDDDTLRLESRHERIKKLTSSVTLDDVMVELEAIRSVADVYRNFTVETIPTRIDTGAVILATLRTRLTIAPSGTAEVTLNYSDPNDDANKVSAVSIETPEAGTDFNFSSLRGQNIGDLNDDLQITVDAGVNRAVVTFQNNGKKTGYIGGTDDLFQLRGIGAYRYDAVLHEAVETTAKGNNNLDYKLPYQDNANIGNSFMEYFKARWSSPRTQAALCTFNATKNTTLFNAAASTQIGDRVTITETVTGIDNNFIVHGIELVFEGGNNIVCSWVLQRAEEQNYWILGDSTYSKLGDTTRLYM